MKPFLALSLVALTLFAAPAARAQDQAGGDAACNAAFHENRHAEEVEAESVRIARTVIELINGSVAGEDLVFISRVGQEVATLYGLSYEAMALPAGPSGIARFEKLAQVGRECDLLRQKLSSNYDSLLNPAVAKRSLLAFWRPSTQATPEELQRRLQQDVRTIDQFSMLARTLTDELQRIVIDLKIRARQNRTHIAALEKALAYIEDVASKHPDIAANASLANGYRLAAEGLKSTLASAQAIHVSNQRQLQKFHSVLILTHQMAVNVVIDARMLLEDVRFVLSTTDSQAKSRRLSHAAGALFEMQMENRRTAFLTRLQTLESPASMEETLKQAATRLGLDPDRLAAEAQERLQGRRGDASEDADVLRVIEAATLLLESRK